jgi:hypothetical protein
MTAPFDPTKWVATGFTEQEARVWHRWRIAPETAVAWRRAGVADGLCAAQWSVARVTPATVGDWRAAGLDAIDAVRCHEMGYDLAAAREFKRRGLTPEQAFTQWRSPTRGPMTRVGVAFARMHELKVPPQVIRTYLQANWTDEEALAWARQHVPADVAKLWLALGLTPAEGAELTRAGRTPAEVVREWWRAGIPYDEVADWLGAGLTAAEAVEQRARGITVEHAATLRALRRGGGTKPD